MILLRHVQRLARELNEKGGFPATKAGIGHYFIQYLPGYGSRLACVLGPNRVALPLGDEYLSRPECYAVVNAFLIGYITAIDYCPDPL